MPNTHDLPPYRPSMAVIFRCVNNAYRAHWKAHDNKYPQKLILTPAQADDLLLCRLYGQLAFPGTTPPQRDRHYERPIEIREDTLGEFVAHDGIVTLLSGYDELNPGGTP